MLMQMDFKVYESLKCAVCGCVEQDVFSDHFLCCYLFPSHKDIGCVVGTCGSAGGVCYLGTDGMARCECPQGIGGLLCNQGK